MGGDITYQRVYLRKLSEDSSRFSEFIGALAGACAEAFSTRPWYGRNDRKKWETRIRITLEQSPPDTILMLLAYMQDEIVGFTWGYLKPLGELEKQVLKIRGATWIPAALDPVRQANEGPVYYFAELGVKPKYRGPEYPVAEELMLRHLQECQALGHKSFLVRTTTMADVPLRWFQEDFGGKVLLGPDDYGHKEHLILLWVPSIAQALVGCQNLIARHLPPAFFALFDIRLESHKGLILLRSDMGSYPVVQGIPILLQRSTKYLSDLGSILTKEIEELQEYLHAYRHQSWAMHQHEELVKRLAAVRIAETRLYEKNCLQESVGLNKTHEVASSSNEGVLKSGENQTAAKTQRRKDTESGQQTINTRYESEQNTNIYTRISWGHRSTRRDQVGSDLSDAGELYATLAAEVRKVLPANGVFVEIGCGVGRTVWDAANIAERGLALGIDFSFSKVLRARQIVRGGSAVPYPSRQSEGVAELQVPGHFRRNAVFAVGDGSDTKLPPASVDCVVLSFLLGVASDPVAVLIEALRILKPGASLIIADPLNSFYEYSLAAGRSLTVQGMPELLRELYPGVAVETCDPFLYLENSDFAKTVTYSTQLMIVRKPLS